MLLVDRGRAAHDPVAAHGIGTSRAFSVSPEAGTYASLATGMHGILGGS